MRKLTRLLAFLCLAIRLEKGFDVIPAAKRMQANVDGYNKTVETINKASAGYNKSNTENNKKRNEMLNRWNGAARDFFDQQMPYAK